MSCSHLVHAALEGSSARASGEVVAAAGPDRPGEPDGALDPAFAIDGSRIVFGDGALDELGDHARALGLLRVGLFTDRVVGALPHVERARASLARAGVDCAVYDGVRVEPTDRSFEEAARFAASGRFDGFVSVGGGSVIDTCKAAALLATVDAPLSAWLNRPVGEGRAIPGPLPPHVACPTTCGTGSETTGIAVCDVLALGAKTGIASPRLRPTLALVDPTATRTLPAAVVAASGFDVLCHAIESYTARPSRERPRPPRPSLRPMSQGRNPWSDLGAVEALRLGGRYLVRAATDASDHEARDRLAWAATLAGVAFGNAGVHLPHAMAYAVAGRVRGFRMPGYDDPDGRGEPLVPHGVSVVVSAPSALAFTAPACPARHLEAARALGFDVGGASEDDAGDVLAAGLERLLRATGIPVGLRALGYQASDVAALVEGTIVQERLLANAPRPRGRDATSAAQAPIDRADLAAVFERALAPLSPAQEAR